MMICPQCNNHYERGRFCPDCGAPLIEEVPQQKVSGISLDLGDANAISGGLHVSDSHNVSNVDNSVHNITNNTSTINNITQVSAQKTEMELLQERKVEFMEVVKAVYAKGIIQQDDIVFLEKERVRIGLDEATAKDLIETIKKTTTGMKQTSLSAMQSLILKQIEQAIESNQASQIKRLLPRLEAIAKSTIDEKSHYLYNIILAALNPQQLINEYEDLTADDYWQAFWVYIAYTKLGYFKKAEEILLILPRHTQYPEENITILSSVGALREFGKDIANDFFSAVTGMYSSELENFVMALYHLISPEGVELDKTNKCITAFYLDNLLQFEDAEERARREKEERARAEEENSRRYNLRLNSVGSNSFKVAIVLKSNLDISLSEAKLLVDCCPIDIMKKQKKDKVLNLYNLLQNAGADVEIINV